MENKINFIKSTLIIGFVLLMFSNTQAQVIAAYDASTFGNIKTKIEPSLEYNYVFFPDSLIEVKKLEKYPMQMPILRKEDILYSETIIEDIDAREKKNRHFIYQTNDDDENGDQRFIAILIKILNTDTANIKAYAPNNDRFTTPLTIDSIRGIFNGTLKTDYRVNPETQKRDTVTFYEPNSETPVVDNITTFRIKAQHIFDNRTSRMYYRILAIAPVARMVEKVPVVLASGETVERDSSYLKTLFWLYYPKLRKNLAEYKVYNPKNQKSISDWAYILENRYFDSHIIKTSYENYTNKELKNTIKDPKKRLQESDKIRQRIDDFEQDRWVY
jgi:gliding motility associated protien GldN